ncbi:MAG: 30S ribosomal protein S18, partial [Candidatus Paceibacterota bacterium]
MKKQCYFNSNNIKHIDYKDVETLKKFITPHARMT